jgi:hypothetical protein
MNQETHNINEISLHSQATFSILVKYELMRVQRYPNPVTLLYISFSLMESDPKTSTKLKRIFVGILNSGLRASDIPAYYGEDYLVLMPATNEAGGTVVAKRLIDKLTEVKEFAAGHVHIGIATYGGQGTSAEKLIEQAKSALQDARQAGSHAYLQYFGK